MTLLRWEERLAPFDGIAAVVLWVIGVVVLAGPANQPGTDSSPERALAYFVNEDGSILLGTFLFMLGTLFFLWFVGFVRARLYVVEGGASRLTGVAYAGGVVMAASLLVMGGIQAAGAINNDHLSAEAAQVYLGIGDGFFYAAELAAAIFLMAIGLAAVGTRVLPAWFGWVSLVIAIWLVIPPVGWAALIFAFPLWMLLVSGLLLATERTT